MNLAQVSLFQGCKKMNKEDGEISFSFYSFSNGKDGEMNNIKPKCHIRKINSIHINLIFFNKSLVQHYSFNISVKQRMLP